MMEFRFPRLQARQYFEMNCYSTKVTNTFQEKLGTEKLIEKHLLKSPNAVSNYNLIKYPSTSEQY